MLGYQRSVGRSILLGALLTTLAPHLSSASGGERGTFEGYEEFEMVLEVTSTPPEAIAPGVSSAWASSVRLAPGLQFCVSSDFDVSAVGGVASAATDSCAGFGVGGGTAAGLADTGVIAMSVGTSTGFFSPGPILGSANASVGTTISGGGDVQLQVEYSLYYLRTIFVSRDAVPSRTGSGVPIKHFVTFLRVGNDVYPFGVSFLADTPVNQELEIIDGELSQILSFTIDLDSPSGSMTAATVALDESRVDFDGDGRFSCLDADAIDSAVSSPPSDSPAEMDVDADGFVTSADADWLRSVLNSGIGSGLAGDCNRDCVVDCEDVRLLNGLIGSVVSDPDYRLPGDLDLDGVIDSADRAGILNLLSSTCVVPDVDGSGCVDFADLNAVIASYGLCSYCAADVDSSGAVDFADVTAVIAGWGCP